MHRIYYYKECCLLDFPFKFESKVACGVYVKLFCSYQVTVFFAVSQDTLYLSPEYQNHGIVTEKVCKTQLMPSIKKKKKSLPMWMFCCCPGLCLWGCCCLVDNGKVHTVAEWEACNASQTEATSAWHGQLHTHRETFHCHG